MNPFLNIAIQASRAASRIILRFVDRLDQVAVHEKSDHRDLVTQVDQLSEAEIIAHIKKVYPNHAILAEESGRDHQNSEFCWIIDPIDGTMNFAHGHPHFCISIALQKKDQTEMACIYDPIRQELFTAVRGRGAQLNNRRMRVSATQKAKHALIATAIPFRHPESYAAYFKGLQRVLPEIADIRRAGSAALDLAYVACGRLDGYWERHLSKWDIAAGALLVQEAGGIVTDFDGHPGFLETGDVLAGNFPIHKTLQSLLSEC